MKFPSIGYLTLVYIYIKHRKNSSRSIDTDVTNSYQLNLTFTIVEKVWPITNSSYSLVYFLKDYPTD